MEARTIKVMPTRTKAALSGRDVKSVRVCMTQRIVQLKGQRGRYRKMLILLSLCRFYGNRQEGRWNITDVMFHRFSHAYTEFNSGAQTRRNRTNRQICRHGGKNEWPDELEMNKIK
jgi:hypothetical protein